MDEHSVTAIEAWGEVDIALDPGEERSDRPELAAIARLGPYELLGRMAVGGMAEIFLARERATAVGGSRQLVVKVMRAELAGDPDLASMFLQEGRLALRLAHPNICHAYACGVEAGRCFIAMEHVRGVTLRDVMRRAEMAGYRLPPPVVAKIAAHVAEALHSAHRAVDAGGRPLGVVHRDVSPHNVMIGASGVVKLLDFGVARSRGGLHTERSGTIKGKLGYLAPEQCLGKAVDARTDVFALGVCAWEALTGRRLYDRSGDVASLTAVVEGNVPEVRSLEPSVPEELSAILARALARSPDDRFASAAELQHALERFLADRRELVTAARIASVVEHLYGGEPPLELDRRPEVVAWIEPERRPRRHPGRWVAAGLLATVALGAVAWTLASPEPPPSTTERAVVSTAAAAGGAPAPEPPPPARTEPPVPAVIPQPLEACEAPELRAPRARRPRPPPPGGFVDDPGF